jgi:glycosyltransferase involved in cell wall biosynthesis
VTPSRAGTATRSVSEPQSPPPIRVLHLITSSARTPYFASLFQHTDAARAELTIASLESKGDLQRELQALDIPTFSLDADRGRQYPAATAALAQRLRRGHYDVVQTHLLEASVVGLAASRLARTRLAVFTAHHSHEVPLHRKLRLLAADAVCARMLADLVIAPSEDVRQTLTRVHRLSTDKVTVIRHGVDARRAQPHHGVRERFRAEHGLGDELVLAAVSRHFWIKNLDSLVSAFAMVAQEEPRARLVIVGDGDTSRVSRRVTNLGLGDRVLLLGSTPDIADVYGGADLLVHPSRAESFGLVVVEAMVAGLPVVATPVGIAPEAIRDGKTGFLVRDPTPAALAAGIRRALQRRRDWPSIGAAAAREAEAYAPATWAQGHVEAYEERLRHST